MDYPEPTGNERQVPLEIWRTASFQAWYASQKQAGNELCDARPEWVFRIGNGAVLFWALYVDIHVASEGRRKKNEVVLSRPDIAAVVLYRSAPDWLDTQVVLVREFRSTARTPDGCIWELPSGSSISEAWTPELTAICELDQELGMTIASERLRRHGSRQLAGTVSAHHAHLFSCELTENEMAHLRDQETRSVVHGNTDEGEATHIRVRSLWEILADPFVDWSMLGMLFAVLTPNQP